MINVRLSRFSHTTNNGVNIYNESTLFHEALHGISGLYDTCVAPNTCLLAKFGFANTLTTPSVNISLAIETNVLFTCPSFR
jgi:hypothetical protein